MTPFTYARAHDAAEAVRLGGEHGAKYLGGGKIDGKRKSEDEQHEAGGQPVHQSRGPIKDP